MRLEQLGDEELREKMGCAATLEDARIMRRLLQERGYQDLEELPQEVWYRLIDEAIERAAEGGQPT